MSGSHSAGLLLLALAGCFEQNDALASSLVQNAGLLEQDVLATVIQYVMGREPTKLDILDSNMFWLGRWSDTSALRMINDSASPSAREIIADFYRRNPGPGSVKMPLRMREEYRWVSSDGVNPYHVRSDRRTLVGWLERDATTNGWYVRHEDLAWVS